MTAATPASYSESQRREAADWFVIMRAEDAPESATLQAWLRWLEAAEGNRLAFEAIAQAWHAAPPAALAAAPDERELACDDYDGETPVATWRSAQRRRRRRPAVATASALLRAAWRQRRALAATLLAASLIVIVLLAWQQPRRIADVPRELLTRTGEQLDITLADGSRVWLAPRSALLVDFDEAARTVRLREGEAYFSVRKDHRPFRVLATAGAITAVGTAFDVRAAANRVTVAVTEGVVSVAPLAPAPGERESSAVRVGSGQQVTIQAHRAVAGGAVIATPSPGERALWRAGVLVYRDEPLRDVVADVARYSVRPIEIVDAAGELRFSGVVYRDAIEEWAAALPESFPVVLDSSGGRLSIRSR